MKKFRFTDGEFVLNGRGIVMGILNVTPDSFSDGGEFFDASQAVSHARKMTADGADIIDIGAMSTRPGSESISAEEEIRRLAPVLDALKNDKMVISVDTVNPRSAEYALEHGAKIINDVSGIFSAEMACVVKKYSAGWVVTHTGGVPSGDVLVYSEGVVKSVNDYFGMMLSECEKFGIKREFICLDPGFGFAKTTEDNIELLKDLEKVIRPDVAFMTALSRKRFIGAVTGESDAKDRLGGTVAANVIAKMKGSDIFRVHDVKENRQAIAIYNSIEKEDTIYG